MKESKAKENNKKKKLLILGMFWCWFGEMKRKMFVEISFERDSYIFAIKANAERQRI